MSRRDDEQAADAMTSEGGPVGITNEPDRDDPVQMYVDRVIKACAKEFGDDSQVPRFVVIAECPPDGRIGMAATADDAIDAHRLLTLGAASVRRAMDEPTMQKAREYWDHAEAAISEGISPPPYGPPRRE